MRGAVFLLLFLSGCSYRSVTLHLPPPPPSVANNITVIQPLNPVIGKIKGNGTFLIKIDRDVGSYIKAKLSNSPKLKNYVVKVKIDNLSLLYNPHLSTNNALAKIEFKVTLQKRGELIEKSFRLQNVATIRGYRYEERLKNLLQTLLDEVVNEIEKL
ncbi:MAG: hypothetical protein GXO61_03970 [Epsilonproteobacteria bacterium]|nr:hypothetical protein [Campylobacterota bacterium]